MVTDGPLKQNYKIDTLIGPPEAVKIVRVILSPPPPPVLRWDQHQRTPGGIGLLVRSAPIGHKLDQQINI